MKWNWFEKPSAFKFTYDLTGSGWAHAGFEVAGRKVDMSVSYLHNTLEELTSAALHLIRGESIHEVVIFMDEPGECQLELKRETEKLTATITHFEDWKSWGNFDESKHKASSLIQFEISTKKFAMEVLNVLYKLHQQYGLAGYREKWVENDFPFEKYQALEVAIKQHY